jgi:hypothetical protein
MRANTPLFACMCARAAPVCVHVRAQPSACVHVCKRTPLSGTVYGAALHHTAVLLLGVLAELL